MIGKFLKRRLVTAALAGALALGQMVGLSAAAAGPSAPLQAGEAADHVTFGVVSDTHVTQTNFTTQARLAEAFRFFSGTSKDPNSSKLDAVCVAGDLTDTGDALQLGAWSGIMKANLAKDVDLVASMGNHENNHWKNFENATGEKANAVYKINGYTFITISPGAGTLNPTNMRATLPNTGWYHYIVPWLEKQLKAAEKESPDKPIFVFFHHPIPNTFYVSHEWNGDGLKDVFKDHPRTVTFAGHIHSPNNNPLSIWQDGGYTAINTVTLKYFELESGMTYGSVPPNSGNAAQGLVLDVTGNTVTVYNYDFISKSWIDQTWTFTTADDPANRNMPYTTKGRTEQAKKPEFKLGSNIQVNKTGDDGVRVEFNQAYIPENTVGDIVHSYRYAFVNTATGKTDVTYKAFSEYYFLPTPRTLVNEIGGLDANAKYELQIYAIDAYGLESERPLTAGFQMDASLAKDALLTREVAKDAELVATTAPLAQGTDLTAQSTNGGAFSEPSILPDTGDSGTTAILVVGVLGLAALAAGAVLAVKGRKEDAAA
ncbi:MAG: metallophosphoesterase [Oscillospiraceae bacterium]|jgi:LPXTG-motif cell wall-anchored protein|nr:metallophosphoesterase [Oscillospiraceae bacterium]